LIRDSERRKEMGRNAKQLVEQNYTWDRVTEQTEKAYIDYLTSKVVKAD
jgi:glycosyltransferase involved in cell wall biosynthesis